jgi:ketosteroid isomerase-like protein
MIAIKRVISLTILLLLNTCAAFAQTAPDAAELTKLLNDFLAGASRNDAAIHERFWADDLIYTRSAGRRVNKAEILRDVRSAPPPKPDDPKTVFTAEDVRIQQYGNTAIVAFRLVSTTEIQGTKQVANLLNSGTFVKRNGRWQVVNWQSTRMPRTEVESKRELTGADAAFHQALAMADINKLTALTDATFIWTHGSGQMSRKQMFDDLSSGRLKYAKPEPTKSSVSVYGETAVVRGEWVTPKVAHYTLTFINSGGVWKAVSMHTSQ